MTWRCLPLTLDIFIKVHLSFEDKNMSSARYRVSRIPYIIQTTQIIMKSDTHDLYINSRCVFTAVCVCTKIILIEFLVKLQYTMCLCKHFFFTYIRQETQLTTCQNKPADGRVENVNRFFLPLWNPENRDFILPHISIAISVKAVN